MFVRCICLLILLYLIGREQITTLCLINVNVMTIYDHIFIAICQHLTNLTELDVTNNLIHILRPRILLIETSLLELEVFSFSSSKMDEFNYPKSHFARSQIVKRSQSLSLEFAHICGCCWLPFLIGFILILIFVA